PSTFLDGASNTIAFAEHYAFDCGGNAFLSFLSQPGLAGAPHRATFADWTDAVPVTSGNPPVSTSPGRGITFQVAPARKACKPWMPQTPPPGGMMVAVVDGSVRTLSPGMAETTFWGAVTPDKGETLGNDW